MEIKRHLGSAAILAAFLAFNTATSKPSSSSSSGSSAGSVSGSTASANDISPVSTMTALGCAGKKTDGCRVLSEFSSAGPLTDLPASGEKVWVGYSYGIGGAGDGKREYFFLQMKAGKTTPLGALPETAALDVSASARSLIPGNPGEEKDAAALLSAVLAGAAAPPGSGAAGFVRTSQPPSGYHSVVKTTGSSIGIMNPGPWYGFLRKAGDRVLIVEYDDGKALGHGGRLGAFALAWCSELWPLR